MTAKDMAHWERWHRRGRRKFQLFATTAGSAGVFATHVTLDFAIRGATNWFDRAGFALGLWIIGFFALGLLWDFRTKDYIQQRDSALKDQRGAN